ncbi:MAG: hypothetical protein COZ31_02130 [Nitrospirae bacterium CG_4_10_14_3_um_filter_44_29]|nr:hypothetical protein [Nitrospirota bacterium]OIO28845.1 MAG: hypothetical protein AUJ60_06600 [Nitrospirae bacterium CG1_02_44_142]PIP71305.1 MAG: hypothetical protein COW90_00765 [Nitrospirae bacterium CG22_combo_CG10-13_8_21_14_all_44_11]PIV41259.1 MAG: hypothetical protein COS28_05605 [Nitrospirae bacterium CG02_land_8_20_14_3_00_44_33]PIV65684.1 MAG: hypothetical protein COS10_10070 [Nitrospirae bacterium CG01_land_8_20_14_3_00_44_22]PIW90821.1 MAG: hypothetical protein COZ93_00070 [Nit
MNIIDYQGNVIRLTDERLKHIKEHPEIAIHTDKINETLSYPDRVIKSQSDNEVRLYYRQYEWLSIGDKYLCVVVKFKAEDAFVITAYFTDSIKKGDVLWKK